MMAAPPRQTAAPSYPSGRAGHPQPPITSPAMQRCIFRRKRHRHARRCPRRWREGSPKAIRATTPGSSQNGDLCILSHAQNAKQPPISPVAATTYQKSDLKWSCSGPMHGLGDRRLAQKNPAPI